VTHENTIPRNLHKETGICLSGKFCATREMRLEIVWLFCCTANVIRVQFRKKQLVIYCIPQIPVKFPPQRWLVCFQYSSQIMVFCSKFVFLTFVVCSCVKFWVFQELNLTERKRSFEVYNITFPICYLILNYCEWMKHWWFICAYILFLKILFLERVHPAFIESI